MEGYCTLFLEMTETEMTEASCWSPRSGNRRPAFETKNPAELCVQPLCSGNDVGFSDFSSNFIILSYESSHMSTEIYKNIWETAGEEKSMKK